MGQVTRHGAGRADVSPGGVEMKNVPAAKSVCHATDDAEKYFSLDAWISVRDSGGSARMVQSGTSSPTRKKPKKAKLNAVQYSSWSVGSYIADGIWRLALPNAWPEYPRWRYDSQHISPKKFGQTEPSIACELTRSVQTRGTSSRLTNGPPG